ncbi:hypothetical protein ACBJ59_36690 [Nonomuraea sp. MTCD27]|uniref:hypothetical protein n=1 Tax=Nonomuraea sp. MTCD27 TaxID=1676747 RepID=UPI0035C24D88
MAIWRGPDGLIVEIIVLNRSPLYKISQMIKGHRYFVAYAHDVDTLTKHVELADLVEVIDLRGRRQTAS